MITGPAIPVTEILAADLQVNGGKYEIQTGPPIPIIVVANGEIASGPVQPVYEVPNTGQRITGPVQKVRVVAGKESIEGPAIKVIVVGGSL